MCNLLPINYLNLTANNFLCDQMYIMILIKHVVKNPYKLATPSLAKAEVSHKASIFIIKVTVDISFKWDYYCIKESEL